MTNLNELVANRKRLTMMAYPNRSHGIFEGGNTTMRPYKLMTRYLEENSIVRPQELEVLANRSAPAPPAGRAKSGNDVL